jgi:hypothetical protein
MSIKITTKIKYLVWLNKFTSRDPARMVLSGVNIQPCQKGGIFISATNGRVLGRFHDSEGSCSVPSCQIDVKSLLRSLDYKNKDLENEINIEDGAASLISRSDMTKSVKKTNDVLYVEGIYPHLEQTIPRQTYPLSGSFVMDPLFLSLFVFDKDCHRGITIFQSKQYDSEQFLIRHSAYVIAVNGYKNFIGVIMPIRSEFAEIKDAFGVKFFDNKADK